MQWVPVGANAKLTANSKVVTYMKMLCSASLLVQPITAVFCFTVHCCWEGTRSPSLVLTYRAWLQCHNYFKLVFLLPYCSIIYIVLFPIDKSFSLFFIVMMWINCCSTVMCLVLQWSHWFQCNSNLLCFCPLPIYTPFTNALIYLFIFFREQNTQCFDSAWC